MKARIIASVCCALLIVACSDQNSSQSSAGQQMPPQAVSVITIAQQSVPHTLGLPGRVSPFKQSQVRPQVDGVITARLFEEGSLVSKGQQLYQIDDARFKAALNSAKADLNAAQATVKTAAAKKKRYQGLLASNSISQQDYDDVLAQLAQAEAQVGVAKAAVDLAQVNLAYTKVFAPIDGRISRSFVTEGALVTSNQSQALATITQLDPVFVDMQQSGQDAIELRMSMQQDTALPVSLIVNEQSGTMHPHQGQLQFSEVTVDQTTGSIALRAVMPNPEETLLPGLFVRARIDLGATNSLIVPQRATIRGADGSLSVWVVDANSQAQPRKITVSRAYEDQWVVSSGLSQGDQVVVTGYQKIGPGSPVAAQPWQDPAAAKQGN